MSFLGGAECSTAGNPLTQFTKHVQDDKSLQRDRLVGRGPNAQYEGMRTQRPAGQADQMMNNFLQQPGMAAQGPHNAFAMEQLRKELPSQLHSVGRPGSTGWAAEHNPEHIAQMEAAFRAPQHRAYSPAFNSAEFQQFQHSRSNGQVNGTPPQAAYQQPTSSMYHGSGLGMGMMPSMYRPSMGVQSQPNFDTSAAKGKGRMVELDDKNWEEQFAEIDATGIEDEDAEANAAIERELNEMDRSVPSETLGGDFESIWRGIQAERAQNRELQDNPDMDYFPGPSGDIDLWDNFDTVGTGIRDPQFDQYQFEEENIFKNVGDPFGEGMKILEEAGNLSLAALAFEAAVQKDPKHVEAWNMLGSAQAQNEKETPAIRALEEASKLDPGNLDALMGLAVSYTNEGYDATAYRTLERWLSVKYPSIINPEDLSSPNDVGFTDRHILHEKVTALFIKAAQLSPLGETMDPDVQVGLGVLFYGSEQYDKAVDCFQSALESTESGITNQRQQVHLLWNRLGATLANSGRSEEAIAAYERALAANPSFVRARYNLGVSCINIGCYDEAAQHLLGALSMHAVAQREGKERIQEVVGGAGSMPDAELERMIHQNQSTNLYETLRRVFGQMDRRDLADRVVPGMDVESFRNEFDF